MPGIITMPSCLIRTAQRGAVVDFGICRQGGRTPLSRQFWVLCPPPMPKFIFRGCLKPTTHYFNLRPALACIIALAMFVTDWHRNPAGMSAGHTTAMPKRRISLETPIADFLDWVSLTRNFLAFKLT